MNEIQKTKIVCIDDLSGKRFFKIRLFGVMDGLDFFDKITGSVQGFFSNQKTSVKEYLRDLIPLAVPMDETGTKIVWPDGQSLSLDTASAMFENPMALIELGWEVLAFQQIFFERLPIFQRLIEQAKKAFPFNNSASETKSAQS